MKMCISGRQSKGLALVSVIALVLLGALPACQKKVAELAEQEVVVRQAATSPIAACGTVNITPGNSNKPTSVDVKICTIVPGQAITWLCDIGLNPACKRWQVIFDPKSNPGVDVAKLFVDGATKFPSQPNDTQSVAGDVLAGTLFPAPNTVLVVKYTVQTVGSQPYDPHIIPMGP